MAIVSTHCGKCGSNLEGTVQLIPGHTVVRCQICRWFAIQSDGRRFFAADYRSFDALASELKNRAVELERARNEDWRIKAAIESDDSDPRWI
jgi:hypothetical protein